MNVYLRMFAGALTQGDGNVFVGFGAGSEELGSNRLYIENSGKDSNGALIYGEFDNNYLRLNALTSIKDALTLEPRPEPSSPSEGMIYFDSGTSKLRAYGGGSWHDLW